MAEDPPTADQVFAAVLRQPLSTTNPAIQSYEAEIEMGTMGMRYSFWYRKTNATALWVVDSQDGTPVLVATEGSIAIYDPLTSTIFLMTNKYASLEFKVKYSDEPGKSSFNMNAGLANHPSGAKGEIQLPPPLVFSNFPPKLESKGKGVFEVRCSVARKVPTADVPVTWFFRGVTDWPAKDIPYRAMEMQGAPYLNVLVRSVNQPIPEGYFRFPMQELLTAGLPVRRISSGITDETSQITSLMVANAFIRRALTGQDPENVKQAIQKFCQSLNSEIGKQKLQQVSGEALQEYKKRSEDPQTWEKILSAITKEQWESIRLANYPDLSSEEFNKKRTNSEFRKQLAAKIVTELDVEAKKQDGPGPTPEETVSSVIRGYQDVAKRLDRIDLEAIRAKDQKIAAQLRQAFQLEATSSK